MSDSDIVRLCQRFIDTLAHVRLLNMRVIHGEKNRVTLELPVQEKLINVQGNGYMLGGVLTTLVDTACSCSTLSALPDFELAPTLDLRIDHMRTPVQEEPLFVDAECYRVTRNVMFTRAVVYQSSPEEAIATTMATFMRLGPEYASSELKALVTGKS